MTGARHSRRPAPPFRRAVRLAALGAALALPAAGQVVLEGTERLADDRPEAWAMRWTAAALSPGGFGPAAADEPGSIALDLEAGWLPSLSERQRRVGFDGTKLEDLNRSSWFARPRIRVGLPASLSLEADWLPPVEIDGATANLVSLGVAGPLPGRGAWRAGWRASVQGGTVEGDFTCPAAAAAAGDDPVANPYGCERASEDEIELLSVLGEASIAYRPARFEGLDLSLAALVRHLDATFRVHADWSGIVDRSRLEHSGVDWGLRLGAGWTSERRWKLAGELSWTPLDVARAPDAGDREDDPLLQLRVVLGRRLR